MRRAGAPFKGQALELRLMIRLGVMLAAAFGALFTLQRLFPPT